MFTEVIVKINQGVRFLDHSVSIKTPMLQLKLNTIARICYWPSMNRRQWSIISASCGLDDAVDAGAVLGKICGRGGARPRPRPSSFGRQQRLSEITIHAPWSIKKRAILFWTITPAFLDGFQHFVAGWPKCRLPPMSSKFRQVVFLLAADYTQLTTKTRLCNGYWSAVARVATKSVSS